MNELVRKEVREGIEDLEMFLKQGNEFEEYLGEEDNVIHHFIEGVYARELFVPEGFVIVGKLHKYPRIRILAQGECTYVTEFEKKRVKAPFIKVMPAGSKTAVYAHTDLTIISIHKNREDTRDLKKLEEELIAKNHKEIEQ